MTFLCILGLCAALLCPFKFILISLQMARCKCFGLGRVWHRGLCSEMLLQYSNDSFDLAIFGRI